MSTTKRWISLLLALVMVLGLIPLTTSASQNVLTGEYGYNSGITWSYDLDMKVLTIEGTGKMRNLEIEDLAYDDVYLDSEAYNAEHLYISEGITHIGSYAFSYCDKLKYVEIPESVESIGEYAFDRDCPWIDDKISVGADVVIDNFLIASAKTGEIRIETPIKYVVGGAIENATHVTFGESVEAIGSYAVDCYDNPELKSVTVFNPECEIDDRAFGKSVGWSFAEGYHFYTIQNLTVYGYPDSTAQMYCEEVNSKWNWKFIALDSDPENPPAPSVDTHDTLDQLTELDYLAFSKLAYRNLDQLKGKTVRQVIGDKWDGFWTDGTTTEFLNSEIYGAIANWTVYKTGSGEDGFYYAVFKAPDAGQAVLAYRGSENLLKVIEGNQDAIGDWFKNDFPMILGGFIGTQFEDACKAYTDLAGDPEIWMITTTGHSLGGAWADAVSALYGCDGVSMNAVPILDVVYDTHPQYYGATFTGLSDWNFVDHANVVDVMAGMNEVMFSSSPLKPYISHENMYTGANIFTYHSMWSMVQRSNDGSVSISDVKATYIPNPAMTQERKLSYVSLGSTSNDMLNKGMNSLKRQSAYGGNGEDQIYTGSSWDKLVGGAGFDVLDGGYGDDTYFYFKGDGHDYIRDIGGSDALYLYGYTKDDAIAIVEDEEIGFIDIYCNGEPVISIYEDGREYKSFTFDKFEVYVVWGNQDYDVYDITSFFKTRKYGSHLLISCPVSIEILDPDGNVVHTLTDGEVGSWYTEYGNFYVFEEENGEYGKVLDLVEGYTARIVGADEGTMDVTYQIPVDGELSEPVSVSGVPVTENLSATIEETEDGDVYLVIDEDSDGETDSERKLYGECPFTDVPEGSFYYEPVMWAVENGITSGTSETTFDPSGLCLRAHVVTFLYRAAGSPAPASTKNPFTDVKSGDFYYNPVLWAVANGITQGVSKTQFGSTQVCNRAAVVTFLWRTAGSPEPESTSNPFVDVKTTDFFYKPVLWAVENGITNGVDATHFGPATDCNRAQVVTFLYRAAKINNEKPVTPTEPEIDPGLVYVVYDDHVEITNYTGTATEIGIPARIEGLPVTVIGEDAFNRCYDLINVSIPEGVTTIGDFAFQFCSNLTTISIPDTLVTIGDSAFDSCYKLTDITLPAGISHIGGSAFVNCDSLISISIPEGITAISDFTFYACDNLTSVLIPESVTSIGYRAFFYCDSLTAISIPEGVISIGNEAFARCYHLNTINFDGNAPVFGENVFDDVTGTAYYPANNFTWTTDVMQDYGGDITWVANDSGQKLV